jgi:hypothetical protein
MRSLYLLQPSNVSYLNSLSTMRNIFFLMLFLGVNGVMGQTTIYSTNFGTTNNAAVSTITGWTTSGAQSANLNLSTASASSTYSTPISPSGSANLADGVSSNVAGTAITTLAGQVNTTGYSSIELAFGYRASSSSYTATVTLDWSSDGSTWNNISLGTLTRDGVWRAINGSSWLPLPVGAENQSNLRFRFTFVRANTSGNFRIDDFTVRGTVAIPAISSTATGGNWSSPSSWVGGVVPTASDNAVIVSGAVVTMDNTSFNTRNAGVTTTVDAGGTLATNVTYINNGTTTINGSFQLNGGGWVSDAGGTNPFVYGSNGTLIFNAPYTANNGNYWPTSNGPFNVTVNASSALNLGFNRTVAGTFQTASGITLSSATLTLNGTCQINAGGFFNNSPIYGNNSLLRYNTGSTYGRGLEWTVGSGTIGTTPGYPNDVQASNNTVINVPNTGNGGSDPFSTAMGMARDLTIDAGSALYMDFGGNNNKSGSLTVRRNIVINGDLSLGNAIGGDMNVVGNWTNAGTFIPNNRLVSFNGIAAQTLTGPTTFAFLTIDNAAGLTLQPASEVTVNQTLALTNGRLTLGANNVTVGSGGTITGFDATKYFVTNSTGQLRRTVGAGNSIFPVGNSSYNPITYNNAGTIDIYGVRVVDGVHTTGTFNTKTVSRRWITSEAVAGGSNLSIVGQYNNGEPNSGFAAATDPYIGFYNGTSWSQVAATAAGSNPFTFSSNSNLSPSDLTAGTGYFALGKDNAFISVASNLVITGISPSSPTAGSGFSVTVRSQDAYGEFVNVVAGTSFTLSTNGNAGVIGGTITGTLAAGTSTVTVTGVTLASAGTGVTLTATRNSGDVLAAGTSNTFSVLAAATQLALVGVPATGNVGVNLSAFTVEARRPDNSVDNTYTGNITIAKASGVGTLSGTLTVAAVAGVATFNNLQLDAAGTYTLSATSGALTPATSGNIVVTLVPVVIYLNPFESGTLSSPTYSGGTTTLATNLSNSVWTIGAGTLQLFGGSSGNALGVSSGTTSTPYTLTFNIAQGYKLNITSYSFWKQTSNSAVVSSVIINGITVSSAATTNSTGSTGTLAVANTVAGLTGTVSTVLNISGTGSFRLDDFTLSGNVTCLDPTAFTVTGGGTRCSDGPGLAIGLSGSQLGINYQLKRDGSNEGSPLAGTGSALAFPVQTLAGNYTIEASNTNGSCNNNATMTGSATVTILPNYTITASAGANGTVTPSGNTEVCSGNNQSYTITPDLCYSIATLTVDGSPASLSAGTLAAGGTYEFTNVTGPHTIDATFVLNTYTLTYTAGAGGSISGTSPQTVACGANGTAITAVPDAGFIFVDWSDASTANPRTDLNINANISVTANFVASCTTPTSLTYSTNPATYCINNLITDNSPSFTGDAATGYAVSPSLPSGLSLSTTTGVISGTPLVSASAADYTVTVTNACGSTSAVVNITISPSVTSGTLSGTQDILVGATTTFSSTVSGGTWSSDDTDIAIVNAITGEITGTGLGTTTITYTVTGCNGPATEPRSVNVTCAPGSYFDEMSNACVICPAGSYCPGNTNMPIPCLAGYFSATTGQSVCTACAAGTSQGAIGQTSCIACSPGSFSATAAATSCQSCAAGTAQPSSGATSCASCPAGTFSDMTGATVCTSCPVNTYNGTTGQTACISCPMGAYSPEGSTACTSCPAGTYYNTMTASCTTCPAGSYCPEGATAPIACPAGYFSAVDGQAVCTACAAGTSQGATGQTSCIACAPGSFSAAVAATSCQSCAAGTAQPLSGATSCASCPVGTFSSTTGSTVCTNCPVNTYNPSTGQTSCTDCPMGQYSGVGASVCTTCPAGTYYNEGTSSCTTCPAGSYCPEGATAPIACPAGYFSALEGQAVCLACSAGTSQSMSGQTSCVACAPGTFSSTTAATSCQSCAAGTAQPLSGATSCTSCPVGTFSSTIGSTVCTNCPVNTYNPSIGQTSCTDCPMGQYSGVGASVCTTCPAGTYYNEGTSSCTTCPAGSYCPEGATAPIACPAGYFSAVDGQAVCTACAAGTSQGASGQTFCIACAPGSFSATTAATSCQSCAAGTAQPLSGATSCLSCPAGTFSSTTGSTVCTNCPVNTYNPSIGQTSCTDCPMGQYSGVGASVCTTCPAGTYYNEGTSSCTTCPAGSYCPEGSTSPIACPAGYYSALEGQAVCLACSAGTSQSMSGQTSCVACAPGTFSSTEAATTCTACAAGTFSAVSGSTLCLNCPINTNSGFGSSFCFNDMDGDGIEDSLDNCPIISNSDQTNVDQDGFGAACDCNDNNPNIYPGATEVCDGMDNDCNGGVDEGCSYNCVTVFETKGNGNFFDASSWEGDCPPPSPIPFGTIVTIHHCISINNSQTLTNNGTIIIRPNAILKNMSTIINTGTFTNNGTYSGSGSYFGNFTNTGIFSPGN